MYLQLVLFMPPFAMVVPSATTRNAILVPAYEQIYERFDVKPDDRLSRLNSLAMGVLQMIASTAVLTGGVVPITSSFLLGGMDWGQWFKYMAVPCYAVIFGAAVLLFAWQRPQLASAPGDATTDHEPTSVSWTPGEVRTAITIGAMTVLWLGDFLTGWDPVIPALLGAIVLFTPGFGVLSWREFENSSPWRLFFVTGSALSIAHAMESSGAAAWMANGLLGHIPVAGLPVMLLLALLLVVVVVVSVMLPNRAGALGILIPLLTSISVKVGINPIPIGLMATLTVQTTTFYPVQNAATLLVYQTRHFAPFDLLRAGLIVFAVSLVVIFAIAIPWWTLVGLPLRP
jgi:di/tricarboxylate transporter